MGDVTKHRIVSHEEWLAERKALLAKEKEFNRLRDALSAERRASPGILAQCAHPCEVQSAPFFHADHSSSVTSPLVLGRGGLAEGGRSRSHSSRV